MAPSKQATRASKVSKCESTISPPTVFATVTPNRNGPNSATAVTPNAVFGRNAREEIMVATILLESRIPLINSKTSARIITRINSEDINTLLSFLYNNICNNIGGFISAVSRIGQVTIHLAQLQHFNHMMQVFGSAEQICNCFTIDSLYTVLQRLCALGMVNGNFGCFGRR
jgi:hypothetical protein